MPKSRLIHFGACLAMLVSVTYWASGCGAPGSDGPGTGGSSAGGTTGAAGSNGPAGTSGNAGTSGQAGNTSTAGTTGNGGSSAGMAGSNATGSAGTMGVAGNGAAGRGGTTGNAGTTGTAGRGGTTGNAGTTGTAGRGGTTGNAGTTGTAGAAGTGVRMDQNGVPLAKANDTTNVSKKYLNLGDMRLINNRWGSDAKNCTSTQQSVSVNSDKSIGWMFSRGGCDSSHGSPDFPEVEFGVAPFGTTSSLLTTPSFSSTTLLPIQIKNLTSASVNVSSFNISISNPNTAYWDNNVEFWISKNDPRTSTDGGVYAEIIAFTGWQASRLQSMVGWPCDKSGSVMAGGTSYNLCHQSDDWSSGHWRFFNFNVSGGPFSSWTQKLDVKAMLTWVMNTYPGFNQDMWLTRIEVGTEVDDNTMGQVRLGGLTFEVNGTMKSIELQP